MPFHFSERRGREGACGTGGGRGCEVGKERTGSRGGGNQEKLENVSVILCNILHKKRARWQEPRRIRYEKQAV